LSYGAMVLAAKKNAPASRAQLLWHVLGQDDEGRILKLVDGTGYAERRRL
jgi:hypothetical protein